MKKLLRSDAGIGAVAALASAYLRFAYATTRWRHVDREKAQAVFDGKPVILCFWHCLVPMAPTATSSRPALATEARMVPLRRP